MLELLHLGGSSGRAIEVQTRLGTQIPNTQAPEPDAIVVAAFRRLLHKHPEWLLRKEPCGFYNCAGHVWASRRTAIYEQEWYERILREDGYRRVGPNEAASYSDLAVYQMLGEARILHVGVVLELRQLVQTQGVFSSPIPWVLSKLNDATGEVLHHFNDVPSQWGYWEVTFWTDRP